LEWMGTTPHTTVRWQRAPPPISVGVTVAEAGRGWGWGSTSKRRTKREGLHWEMEVMVCAMPAAGARPPTTFRRPVRT